jgi:hypothetical protein
MDGLAELLGAIAISGKNTPKGGVGIVKKDIYVFLGEDKNVIQIGEKKWFGRSSTENEVVYIIEDTITDVKKANCIDQCLVIFFSKEKVRYIDFSKNTGGIYDR